MQIIGMIAKHMNNTCISYCEELSNLDRDFRFQLNIYLFN